MRKTTAEIQNYSFESKLDRDTNSKDSGISQMGGNDQHHGLVVHPSMIYGGHIGGALHHNDHFNVISSNGYNGHLR